jgi:glycogen debranching enzyme
VPLTILDGAIFCVSDELGDISAPSEGFFAFDTRFLSRLTLRINGRRPLPLSHGKVAYFSAAFYLRNPMAGGLELDQLTIARERFVGAGMQDRISMTNRARHSLAFDVALELAADFADILTVKEHDFTLGHPKRAAPLPDPVEPEAAAGGTGLSFAASGDFGGLTRVVLSPAAELAGGVARYQVELDPGASWACRIEVFPSEDGLGAGPPEPDSESHFGQERFRVESSLRAWNLNVPDLEAEWEDLEETYERSVADLASLRMATGGLVDQLPAAGMPWFMTVFGRDTLITCYQTLLFGPELSRNALTTLARLQATEDDPAIDAEPGKIIHELRRGRAADAWFGRYYGTVDATPLFLVLLSEAWHWTGDDELARGLREPALRALEWIDRYGDLDGDGFVEYRRRAERGLVNQSWKDSDDSQLFADGRAAEPPIAPCEVQGYVFDAKLRLAEIARDAWAEPELAARLEREARELAARFDEAYWCPGRGGYYALALDGRKERVDALTSNVGHLLWSGIVPEQRVDALVARLTSPVSGLWSGWGVRTMARGDAGFNPLSYHDGSVWPHDNSLIAAGLARYGRWEEAHRIVRSLFGAAGQLDRQLPEVFAGFSRQETPFPIEYPTAARPQAWAAGAPILLLQTLLGLTPDRASGRLVSTAPRGLTTWAGRVELRGVPALGARWNVLAVDGEVSVEEM